MKSIRYLLTALPAIVVLAACSDSQPFGTDSRDAETDALFIGLQLQIRLLRCSPLAYDSVTQTVGPEGGTIDVGPHTLDVPPGALSEPVSITAVVPPEEHNVIHFGPDGLTFARSARLTMSYANCGLINRLLPKRIAHTSFDLSTILYYLLSFDDPLRQRVTGRLEHFSTYAVAW
jgi:hypothetical protein